MNKNFFYLLLFLCFPASFILAQKQANIWYFGDKAGFDFNTGSPPTVLLNSQMPSSEGCASISDANGNLLFYTNGLSIWDKTHNIMSNGSGLMGDNSSTQSAIITPYVGDPNKYYVFTTDGCTASLNGPKGNWDGLKYNIVDMGINAPFGGVVPGWKNRSLVDTTREQIAAARHANGIDYWIITRKHLTNKYYAFLVTCNGIDTANPVITIIGSTYSDPMNVNGANVGPRTNTGYLKISPDSKAILSAFMYGENELYDFNNATGKLSNARMLSTDLGLHYGATFSPDGSVIYIGGGLGTVMGNPCIFRYQRYAANISATEIIQTFPAAYGIINALQIAPDGKIYFMNGTSSFSMGVIHDPNNYASPDFQAGYLSTNGRWARYGLPNFFDPLHFGTAPSFAGKDSTVCSNAPIQLGDTAQPGVNYFWTPQTGLDNPFIPNPVATVSVNSTYIVGVYNNCDTIFDTVNVTVRPLPIPNISPLPDICAGSFITLSSSGGIIYSWSPVASLSNSTISSPIANPASTTTYTLVVTDIDGCTNSKSVSLVINPLPAANAGHDTGICIGASTILSASGGINYSWSPSLGLNNSTISNPSANPVVTTTYSLLVTDMNGCSGVSSVVVAVNTLPVIAISGPSAICTGSITTLTAFGGNVYNWSTTNTTAVITVFPSTTTTYSVIGTDDNGCAGSTTMQLTVNALPVVSFSIDDSSGCAPVCVNLINTTPNTNSCSWNFGDGSVVSPSENVSHCYDISGSYNVSLTVSDDNQCRNTLIKPALINVYPKPTAGFSMNPPIGMPGSIVNFKDESQGGNSWIWNFGDVPNSLSFSQNPQFIYHDSGTFIIQQIIINQYGCSDTAENLFHVQPEFLFYIANSFTPGGDGINDTFYPKGTGFDPDIFEMLIFDRWGNLIWQTKKWGEGWDGRINGSKEIGQVDTYVWKINLKDLWGIKHRYIGHVNLIR